MLTDIERHAIEYYGLDRQSYAGSLGMNEAKKEVAEWLNSMTPEQWEDHLTREKELQEKRKLNHLY